MEDFKDKEIICRKCGSAFMWSAGEQEFFAEKGLTNIPSNCPICRKKKDVRHRFDKIYDIKCQQCGKASQSPFAPPDTNDVLCQDCFTQLSQPPKPEQSSSGEEESSQDRLEPNVT